MILVFVCFTYHGNAICIEICVPCCKRTITAITGQVIHNRKVHTKGGKLRLLTDCTIRSYHWFWFKDRSIARARVQVVGSASSVANCWNLKTGAGVLFRLCLAGSGHFSAVVGV